MQTVTLFYLSGCPYCNMAFQYLEELRRENPIYCSIPFLCIDEEKDAQLAAQYDYYLVPTFYVGTCKVHEGIPSKEAVRNVLNLALQQ